jgi:AcrR family transcriptional regulator
MTGPTAKRSTMNARATRGKAKASELSADQIVTAAIALLDARGVEALSMRALAGQLGCSTMAAYRHIDSREQLIARAAETVLKAPPKLPPSPWYEQLETIARHSWATCWRSHPWVVEYIESGGFTESASHRLVLFEEIFRAAGFDDDDIQGALIATWTFVVGTLRIIIAMRSVGRRVSTKSENAVFEFNLKTWILGLSAMAQRMEPGALNPQSNVAWKSPQI